MADKEQHLGAVARRFHTDVNFHTRVVEVSARSGFARMLVASVLAHDDEVRVSLSHHPSCAAVADDKGPCNCDEKYAEDARMAGRDTGPFKYVVERQGEG